MQHNLLHLFSKRGVSEGSHADVRGQMVLPWARVGLVDGNGEQIEIGIIRYARWVLPSIQTYETCKNVAGVLPLGLLASRGTFPHYDRFRKHPAAQVSSPPTLKMTFRYVTAGDEVLRCHRNVDSMPNFGPVLLGERRMEWAGAPFIGWIHAQHSLTRVTLWVLIRTSQ